MIVSKACCSWTGRARAEYHSLTSFQICLLKAATAAIVRTTRMKTTTGLPFQFSMLPEDIVVVVFVVLLWIGDEFPQKGRKNVPGSGQPGTSLHLHPRMRAETLEMPSMMQCVNGRTVAHWYWLFSNSTPLDDRTPQQSCLSLRRPANKQAIYQKKVIFDTSQWTI